MRLRAAKPGAGAKPRLTKSGTGGWRQDPADEEWNRGLAPRPGCVAHRSENLRPIVSVAKLVMPSLALVYQSQRWADVDESRALSSGEFQSVSHFAGEWTCCRGPNSLESHDFLGV
jgi:hypothetical protein